ncbi:hypothetical protein GN958_ATG23015 [Phytophthora infestans]|uniref:Uncharacterized protein n=1 Tax=Phytophthora infestans TaxID=4787 RepID=A0A8S9TMG7_PHYIN|nr:hypothetical protein GN958_ATG23015 [Phytophthora infestans]
MCLSRGRLVDADGVDFLEAGALVADDLVDADGVDFYETGALVADGVDVLEAGALGVLTVGASGFFEIMFGGWDAGGFAGSATVSCLATVRTRRSLVRGKMLIYPDFHRTVKRIVHNPCPPSK